MKMRNQEKQNFPLSSMLKKARLSFNFHRSARFWFGPLLPVPDLNDSINIKFDIDKEDYMQLLKILNFVAADLLTMYNINPPEDAFRLLYLIKTIFGLSNQNETSGFQGYQQLVAQVHLNNSLALFLIKHGQFAYAHECLQFILQIVKQDKIDIGSDIALTSISNYLAFIKIHQHSQMKQKMTEVIKCLHKIYKKLLSKYLAAGCLESSLMMMFSVYKQHQLYLGPELKEQNNLLLRKFEQSQRVENMHRSVDLSKNKEPIFQVGKQKYDIFLSRNIQYRRSDLEIKKVELYFFTSSLIFSKKSKTSKKQIIAVPERQRYSVQMKKNADTMSQSTRLHHKTNNEDMDYLIIKLDDKKTQNFLHQSTIPVQSRIQKRQITTPRLNIKKVERRGSQTSQKSQISTVFAFSHGVAPKRIKKIDMQDSVDLKVGECILEIIRDGIIISDFLRKNRSYLPWQKMLILIQNLRFSPLFSQFLPIQCLYDVAKVLIPYIGQPINQQAVISQSPQQLIETETNTKIFHVESKYFKIFKMNNYDSNHIDLVVDCFIDEFDHYFDELNRNQYIDKLNSEIFGIPYKKRQYYSVKTYRKSKKSSGEQLLNQINLEKLQQFPYIGSSPFKFLMLMRRKVQLLVYLKQKDLAQQKNNGYLPLTVVRLNKNTKQERVLKLPLYKFKRYFVAQKDDLPNWMRKYGKILLEGYHRCFQDLEYAFSNLQYLNVKSFANKIQLVPAGRYLTPIVAQIIGSNDRIWGICIRRFQQSFVEQTVTFIYNPYFDLLRPVIGMKCYQDRFKVLADHLLEGKVSTTYKKLSDLKLTGKMINLFQFWSIIDF